MKTYPYLLVRGGSWCDGPRFARVAGRFRGAPDYYSSLLGFRLVRSK